MRWFPAAFLANIVYSPLSATMKVYKHGIGCQVCTFLQLVGGNFTCLIAVIFFMLGLTTL